MIIETGLKQKPKYPKKRLLYILLALSLTACTASQVEITTSNSPVPPTNRATQPTRLSSTTPAIILTNTPLPIPSITPTVGPTLTPMKPFNKNIDKGDYLVYHFVPYEKQLFFYDPATDIHIPLLPGWKIDQFTVGMNDRIAFSTDNGENSDIYILDYPFWENSPVNITNTPGINEIPHSWSPDGKQLLLESTLDEKEIIVVWDGFKFSQIHEVLEDTRFGAYEYEWSQDGKFAFPVYSDGISHAEIFVWNGNPDNIAIKVSQKPSSYDRYPAWSPQGDLAFLSSKEVDNESLYSIKIWKDFSIYDGSPVGSPTEIDSTESIYYLSSPNWTNEGTLVYLSPNNIIYEWDGKEVNPIKNFPRHGYPGYWGPNEYWVSIAGYWEDLIYIHNESNKTILETEGRYPPAWSPDGLLAYCIFDKSDNSFTISIWNGSKIFHIINRHSYINAMWRNGEDIHCSNG